MNASSKMTRLMSKSPLRPSQSRRSLLLCHDIFEVSETTHQIIRQFTTGLTQNRWQKQINRDSQDSGRLKQYTKVPSKRCDFRNTPAWLANKHANLMKSVKLPKPGKGTENFSEKRLATLDTSKLLAIAASMKHTDKKSDRLVTALWRNLGSMSVEKAITAADLLYMNGKQSLLYTRAMTAYFYENIETLHLTPSQMIRLLFHTERASSQTPQLLIELESKLEQNLSDFTLDEIASICQILFYKQHRLRSLTLVDKIADRLLDEFDSLTPHNLPMLLKAFRYANYIRVSFYKRLGDHLVSTNYLQNFSNAGQIMHFAFAFASLRITHSKLFTNLLQRSLELEVLPRLKDLSKIIWACGTLVTEDTEHLQNIEAIVNLVRENVTKEQVLKYPDNLMDFFVGLAYLNIYPCDLINDLLGPETIKVLLGLGEGRAKFLQLQFLDASLRVECPEFGRRLLSEPDQRVVETNLRHFSVDVDIRLRKPLVPVVDSLRDALGVDRVQCCFVLPHFKTADILLAFDKNEKKFVNPRILSDNWKAENIERVIVMLLSKAQTSYDNQPLGMLHCKLRQLNTLGYTVVKIEADEALGYTLVDKDTIQDQIMSRIYERIGHTETVKES